MIPIAFYQLATASLATPDANAWAFAGKVAVYLVTAFGAVGYFVGRSVSRAIWRTHLKDCGPDMKTVIDELYADDIEARNKGLAAVAAHGDQLEYLDAAIKEQGKALQSTIAAAFDRMADTMQRIERTLEAVHTEASENTAAIADVVGFMRGKGWTEVDTGRRKAPRRKAP